MPSLKILISAVLLLSLNACGWQLRSEADTVELDSITVEGGSTDFALKLEQALEDDGVLVHDESPLALHLSPMNWNTRTVAVDKVGRAAEIEIKLNLYWQVLSRDKQLLTGKQHIGTSRRYQVSADNATGASDEDQLARDDMRTEMIGRIMRALSKRATELGRRAQRLAPH